MSNSNLNNENNVKTKRTGNKVYHVLPTGKMILAYNFSKPIKIVVTGPGNSLKTNNLRNRAINIVRNTQESQIKNAKSKLKNEEYNKFMRGLLSPRYVASIIKNIGTGKFKNYVAASNNGRLHGFAVIKNYNNNRDIKVIATRAGRGTGKLLMNKIINDARRNGKTRIILDAVPSARGFYNKLGFKPAGPTDQMALSLR